MKQNITKQDLLELNDKQIKALFSYWWETPPVKKNPNTPYARCEYDTGYLLDLPLMSIGDMIEYLDNKILDIKNNVDGYYIHTLGGFVIGVDIELCNALWMAVKEYLNK